MVWWRFFGEGELGGCEVWWWGRDFLSQATSPTAFFPALSDFWFLGIITCQNVNGDARSQNANGLTWYVVNLTKHFGSTEFLRGPYMRALCPVLYWGKGRAPRKKCWLDSTLPPSPIAKTGQISHIGEAYGVVRNINLDKHHSQCLA